MRLLCRFMSRLIEEVIRIMKEKFDMNENVARKMRYYGHETESSNVDVDAMKGCCGRDGRDVRLLHIA